MTTHLIASQDDAFISVFTPSQTKNEVLEAIFVQRHALLEDAVERMDESAKTGNKHHLLYVGPRGSGKTYLVTLLVHRLEQRPDITQKLHIAWLNEDETSTTVLDLLLRIYKALAKRYPETYELETLEQAYELDADEAQTFITDSLLKTVRREHKTLLIIVENLDALFEGLGDIGQKKLRALIQENPHFAIVATAQTLSDYLKKRTHPFFGFFQTTHLKPLTEKEAGELLIKISRLNHREGVADFLKTRKGRARVRALHHLSGGNHRMYIVLSQFITRDSVDALVSPFVKMVDELTPYYQERLRWLPAQQRKIVEFLSTSANTVSVKDIAKRLFATPQTVSSQLKDLREKSYVTSTQRGRESLYEITEPLMRICIEVKENQSHEPLALLVDFIRAWYDQSDLSKRLEDENLSAVARPYLLAAIEKYIPQVSEVLTRSRQAPNSPPLDEAEEAISVQTAIINEDNVTNEDLAIALIIRGVVYGEKGETKKAIDDFSTAINLKDIHVEESTAALLNRGAAYVQENEIEKAINDYTNVIDVENAPVKAIAQALINRGVTYLRTGDIKQSIADYTAATKLRDVPTEQAALALSNRGYAYGRNGEIDKEVNDYTTVIELGDVPVNQLVQALINRGVTYRQIGKIENAIIDYNSVINHEESSIEQMTLALVNRGVSYWQSGDVDRAVADYTTVINLEGLPINQMAVALINRGYAYREIGETKGAINDYRAVVNLKNAPTELMVDAYMSSAEIYASEGRWFGAGASVREALKLGITTEPPQVHNPSSLIGTIFSTTLKPALRKQQIAELTQLYVGYELVTAVLGTGLIEHLGSLYQTEDELPSPEDLDLWLSAWEEASEGVDKLRIPMRILRTGVAFLKTGGQDLGILADLAESERSILKQAFGMED